MMSNENWEACETLSSAISYLINKSYNGDQGGDYMNYWDWNSVTCAAIGILNDALNQITLEAVNDRRRNEHYVLPLAANS